MVQGVTGVKPVIYYEVTCGHVGYGGHFMAYEYYCSVAGYGLYYAVYLLLESLVDIGKRLVEHQYFRA